MRIPKEHIEIFKTYKIYLYFGAAFFFIKSLKRTEDNRMDMFRDKSALFGRELAPGEPPSWPVGYKFLSWIPYP